MKKYLTISCIVCCFLNSYSQSLGGYEIYDWLVESTHPNNCTDEYVTGPPDDSTWVNFNGGDLQGLPGDIITAKFGYGWTDSAGNELLLETCYHPDNYLMRMTLSDGSFSDTHTVSILDWIQIADTPWFHLSADCIEGTQGTDRYILPLDFSLFGLSYDDTVTGFEITFLTTVGAPDLAGAYIIKEPACRADLGKDTTLCSGDTLHLDAVMPGATYLWQDSSTNPEYSIFQQGVFWVEVRVNECIVRDSMSVNFIGLPLVNLGDDTSLCPGTILILDATYQDAAYLWQDNASNSSYYVSQPGTYWVIVSKEYCENSDTIVVSYVSLGNANLGKDTTLCKGQILNLNVFTPFATYLWNNNSSNSFFSVTEGGTYWVEISVNNCSRRDSVVVDFLEYPIVNLGSDTTLCEGQTLLLDVSGISVSYLWQDNSSAPTLAVTFPGQYWVICSANYCSSSDTILVSFLPEPVLDLVSDTTLCLGTSLTLDASAPDGIYLWQDHSTNPFYTVTDKGIYWVKAQNLCGEKQDTITIEFDDCSCYIYFPNAFTPSGDNLNDNFKPLSNCEFAEINFSIFNRWGNSIFYSTDPQVFWDGSSSEFLPESVYLYKFIYSFSDGKSGSRTGHVTLLRQ